MLRPTLFLAADHAGFSLKTKLVEFLARRGIDIRDLSPKFMAGDDYPKIAARLARAVAQKKHARGILVCGNGVGMVIAANRVPGVRAFHAGDEKTTRLARAHNNANVLALSGWHLSPTQATKLADLFLTTRFSTAQRHRRRVKQLQ